MHELIERLKKRLKEPLPGLNAQLQMAPPARGSKPLQVPPDARHSAVLALLYPNEDKVYTVFMKRSDDGHVHSGQISFPGGKVEEADSTYVDTALREANEELGIPVDRVEVLGKLTELYIPPSNFLVYPTLGFMSERPDFVIDPKEVAYEIEVDLPTLLDSSHRQVREIEQRTRWGHYRTQAPSYLIHQKHIIWGATAMMLSELLAIVEELD
jgi:8-oxo-dGTP pyrophosphatase MutT (NUDIX family)